MLVQSSRLRELFLHNHCVAPWIMVPAASWFANRIPLWLERLKNVYLSGFDQATEIRGQNGAAIQKALAQIDTQGLQRRRLPFVFDAFRNRVETQRVGHGHNGGSDGQRILAVRQIPDEGDVDLQGVDGELTQVTQRRVPGAEVVE